MYEGLFAHAHHIRVLGDHRSQKRAYDSPEQNHHCEPQWKLGNQTRPTFLVLRTNAFWGEMVGLLKILCVTYMWVYREGHVNPGECWESYSIALCLQGQSLCDGDAQRLSTYCLCRTARFGPSLYLDGGSKPFNSSSTGFNQSPLASTACT